jgi:hypothetical protein
MQLVLVVGDCPLPPDAAEAAGVGAPALPALSLLLARGESAPAGQSWQQRLIEAFGGARLQGLSIAAVAAAALPGLDAAARPLGAWLAQPVHLQAAANHLRLPADGLLRLDATDAHALCADFARVFGSDGLELHALPGGSLLLTGCEAGAGLPEPSRHVGERLETAGSRVDVALRRLASEVELWLHEHPVNRARARRRESPISTLWLWGGEPGTATVGPATLMSPAQLYGDDPLLAGLARLIQRPLEAAPAHLDAMRMASPDALVLVQLSVHGKGGAGLEALESAWVAPALARLRGGALRSLRVMMLDCDIESTRMQMWKLWRTRRAWWDTLRR